MLVLSRRSGERIVVQLPEGGEILIEVVSVKGKQVRLGLNAPRDCKIMREELLREEDLDAKGD